MINNEINLLWITMLILYLQIIEFPCRGKVDTFPARMKHCYSVLRS